jgi:hypothetical protein
MAQEKNKADKKPMDKSFLMEYLHHLLETIFRA